MKLSREMGQYLKSQRESLGLKIKDIVCPGLSVKTIQRIEQGQTVSEKSLRLYCKQIGFPFHQLFQSERSDEQLDQLLDQIDADLEFRLDIPQSIHQLDEIKSKIGSSHPLMPRVLLLKAKGYLYAGKLDKAENEVVLCMDVSRKHDDTENILGMASLILGTINFYTRSLSVALEATEKAIWWFEQAIDKWGTEFKYYSRYFLALMNKVSFLEKKEQLMSAGETIDKLVENLKQISKADWKATILETKGRLERERGRHLEAIKHLHMGLQVSVDHGLCEEAFQLWKVLGDVHRDLKQPAEAERCYFQALRLKDRILSEGNSEEEKNRRGAVISTAFTALAEMYVAQEQYDKAKHYFEQALQFESDDSRFVDTYMGIGEMFLKRGKRESAHGPFQKALELAEEKGVFGKIPDIHSKLATCFQGTNETRYFYHLKMLHETYEKLKEAK